MTINEYANREGYRFAQSINNPVPSQFNIIYPALRQVIFMVNIKDLYDELNIPIGNCSFINKLVNKQEFKDRYILLN